MKAGPLNMQSQGVGGLCWTLLLRSDAEVNWPCAQLYALHYMI